MYGDRRFALFGNGINIGFGIILPWRFVLRRRLRRGLRRYDGKAAVTELFFYFSYPVRNRKQLFAFFGVADFHKSAFKQYSWHRNPAQVRLKIHYCLQSPFKSRPGCALSLFEIHFHGITGAVKNTGAFTADLCHEQRSEMRSKILYKYPYVASA